MNIFFFFFFFLEGGGGGGVGGGGWQVQHQLYPSSIYISYFSTKTYVVGTH